MTIDAQINPELATETAESLTAPAVSYSLSSEPPLPPVLPDTTVKLPGGYVDLLAGVTTTEAEVRELNGEDEEAIARVSNNQARYFDTILTRGVASIGDHPATKDILDSMLAGDRDALLIAIRRVTFGDEVEYTATCPHCNDSQEPTVLLSRDLKMDTLDDTVEDREWEMTLASGKVVTVTLPDGGTSKALAQVEDRNEGVLNTVLLASTVTAINGLPVVGDAQVRKNLSIRDRREIIKEIGSRNPGPRFGEVSRPCSSCGESIPLPMSLADLFLV